jgi:SAM-dependent methyltransferase
VLFDGAFNKEFGLDARVLVRRFDRQLVTQNEHVTALAARLDEERTARAALEAHLLAKNEAIAALYGSKSWRITAPLRSTRRMARWFVHGTCAWVTLKPGSRPERIATRCLVGAVRFYHAARPSLENMARQTLRWLPAVKTRLQRIILSDTFLPGAAPATDEFGQQSPGILPDVTGRFLDETDCEIETDATPEQLEAMLLRIKAAWQSFGETEPHYSVLTHEAYRPNNIKKNLDTFYATGLDEVNRALAFFSRNHIDLSNIRRVLDYGCGVGRLTVPLARKFPAVLGVDVSEKHIEHARRYAAERRVRNVDFTKIADLEELNYLSDVDFILSLIVLQHNPPPVIAAILRKLLNTLSSGGCAIFQVPTFYQGFRFFCSDYLSKPSSQMEMNAIPQRAVYAIARDSGCDILEVREDNLTGSPLMLSHVFLVQKRGSAH